MKIYKEKPSSAGGWLKKDAFIDKTIISLASLLSLLRARDRSPSWLDKLNAFYKVLLTIFNIVLIALSRSPFFIFSSGAYHLMVLALLPVKSLKRILSASAAAFLLSAFTIAPALLWGSRGAFLLMPAKAFVTSAAAGILAQTKFSELTSAFKMFHMPDFILMILDVCVKSLAVLGEFSLDMMRALKSRSFGGGKGRYPALSGIGGVLFLKSKEMAKETHDAMVCRGFTGKYRPAGRISINLYECVCILINIGLAALFFAGY